MNETPEDNTPEPMDEDEEDIIVHDALMAGGASVGDFVGANGMRLAITLICIIITLMVMF